eukprot:COSAG02_NODE_1371_length_13018_cov_6.783265_6_plen_269_part_00
MGAVLAYSGAGAGFAWAVGGEIALGAAIGLAWSCLLTWLRRPPAVKVPTPGGAVVISGASSGIGRAAAEELAKLGFTVFAGVRKVADGSPLKAAGCRPIILDVTSEASIIAAAAEVKKQLGDSQPLVAVVNNAGVSGSGLPLELETEENMQFVFGANVFGIVRMNQAFLPLFRDQSRGRRSHRQHWIGNGATADPTVGYLLHDQACCRSAVRLQSRRACTIRNLGLCPAAGVCPHRHCVQEQRPCGRAARQTTHTIPRGTAGAVPTCL